MLSRAEPAGQQAPWRDFLLFLGLFSDTRLKLYHYRQTNKEEMRKTGVSDSSLGLPRLGRPSRSRGPRACGRLAAIGPWRRTTGRTVTACSGLIGVKPAGNPSANHGFHGQQGNAHATPQDACPAPPL